MRVRHRYVPIVEAQVGMVLGAAADAVSGGAVSFSLPADHHLTEDNLYHLLAHSVEYIFVDEEDLRPDEEIAVDAARVAGRVLRIFSGADLTEPTTAALFDQVLRYRSA
jgi:hypothetical protein